MIAFTICSNNYLSEAITLGNSLRTSSDQEIAFQIFLVDTFNYEVNYQAIPFKVSEVTEEILPGFLSLTEKYDIIELNTAVKPGIFQYLYKTYSNIDTVIYFDPDVYLVGRVDDILLELQDSFILLTPHVVQPISLDVHPFENTFLNFGLYNLGFLGTQRSQQVDLLLQWWKERTMKFGINEPRSGLFVDQLWMNFVPIFFRGVKVSHHPGLNVAYWNINERKISQRNCTYYVNGTYPLVFFHFSSFDYTLRKLSTQGYTVPAWDHDPLLMLMHNYKRILAANNYLAYKKIIPTYRISLKEYIIRYLPSATNPKTLNVLRYIQKIIPRYFLRRLANLNHVLETMDKYYRTLG